MPAYSESDIVEAPNPRSRQPRIEWVKCPICGESDMQKDTDDGFSLITCVNHACPSNGGKMVYHFLGTPVNPTFFFAAALICWVFALGDAAFSGHWSTMDIISIMWGGISYGFWWNKIP